MARCVLGAKKTRALAALMGRDDIAKVLVRGGNPHAHCVVVFGDGTAEQVNRRTGQRWSDYVASIGKPKGPPLDMSKMLEAARTRTARMDAVRARSKAACG